MKSFSREEKLTSPREGKQPVIIYMREEVGNILAQYL